MIDIDEHIEQLEEGDFITITGIVTKLYFEELMDGRECFHDVEWDIQEYDEDAPLTDKYEGHTPAPWCVIIDEGMHITPDEDNSLRIANKIPKEADADLMADAPLLLEEVKRLRKEVKGLNEVIDAMTQEIEGWQAMKPNQLRECLWWCYDLGRFGREIEVKDWNLIGRLLGADTDIHNNEWRNEE
mgnify:FL=1|tara:strand:+ start:2701 stop:3258 length:558 start_codon:yes stop_codon:yes gene_type:complete